MTNGIAIQYGLTLIICSGPPLPPEPLLVINSSSQLDIHWEVPYSNELYPIESYNILIVNMSTGDMLARERGYNKTSFVYFFDDEVQYCQVLTVNVTAINALGQSSPGSASRGFPVGKSKGLTLGTSY